jgi:chromosome segregation protein
VHTAQGALYEANAEVSRLELELAHLREKRERIEQRIASLGAQLAEAAAQLAAAGEGLEEWRTRCAAAEDELARLERELANEREKLPVAEEAYRTTRSRREELQHALAGAEQARHVERTKVEQAARILDQLAQRAERLREEQSALPSADVAVLERLRESVAELEATLCAQRQSLADEERSLTEEEQARERLAGLADGAQQRLTALEARLQALRQLQDRIARGAGLQGWLAARGFDSAPRIWQGIAIEAGWEDALEAVLRERLNGITLSATAAAAEVWLTDAPPGKLTLVDADGEVPASSSSDIEGAEPLERYVTCRDGRLAAALHEWLHEVYVVADAAAGLRLRAQLPPGAVLVTREGHLYTRHSVNFHAPDSELHGVLSRQREIEALELDAAAGSEALARAEREASGALVAIEQRKAGIAQLREELAGTQQRCHEAQMQAVRRTEEARRLTQRAEQIEAELAEIARNVRSEIAHREEAAEQVCALEAQCGSARDELGLAEELYGRSEAVVRLQREAVQRAHHAHQEAVFQVRAARTKIEEVENTIRALTAQKAALSDSLAIEEEALHGCDEGPWQAELGAAVERKAVRERELAAARDALETVHTQLREIEQERLKSEQRMSPLRERAGEVRLKEQEARLTEEQYAQQLRDSGADPAALAAQLEKGMRANALQGEVALIQEEIRALGAVNLAALEELEAAEARKTYLDAQWQDLTEAMKTLEDAIRRIDRETRERLSSTFEEVNQHFGRTFPALFGGGTAKLVLSGEEILDAGVQVIAQPPGKKNTSIHLLSGGEKALTALALVFALFQLNPAPFCLLDEVDAPLDDYNTQRFCDVVRKMAEHSQFLFISHNKITMEIASQLLGITMQEPGVSRVVAVDIEEAMKLTEEAA